MQVKKKVAHFVAYQIVRYIAQFLYFAGLTALIPLLPLVFFPHELAAAKSLLLLSLVLIIGGFLIIYIFTKSKKHALRALGFTTLVPGLLAVIFAYIGERRMTIFLSDLGKMTPLVETYISTYVPKAWLLAGIYIIVGVALIWWGEQVRQ